MRNSGKSWIAAFLLAVGGMLAQTPSTRPTFDSFDVAAIKRASPESVGRTIRMQGTHQFVAKNFTVNALVAAAYTLNPQHQISGGPEWTKTDHYDILAGTPGEVQPNQVEQMAMLRKLLAERFHLGFHNEKREMSIYLLTVAKTGSKLKESTAPADKLPELTSTVFPDHLRLPARNATMAQFVAMMRRAVLDRPVVDQTGLSGRYDFDLEWTADETQFGGELHMIPSTDSDAKPGLFTAMQQQLGLNLVATRGLADVLVIDQVAKPSEN